ncbi:MAG TPA: hypothetical protein VNL15_07905 [Dehalococcoidia bacterium]|nr:hypothetical protein [Dehalococcoidia bacterium]
MEGYRAGKMFFQVGRNPELQHRFQTDREAVMEEFRLSEAEKKAVRDGDARALYEMGINPYLMVMSSRMLGHNVEGGLGDAMQRYLNQLTGTKGHKAYPTSVSFPGTPKGGKYIIRDEDLKN